jgi:hypothetical protein
MGIVLYDVHAATEPGAYRLDISVDGARSTFAATISADGCAGCCDGKLFFLLSERALAERGNAGQYHMDLHGLVRDVQQGKVIRLPFTFGTDRRFGGSSYDPRPWWRRVAFWRRSAVR